MSNITLEQTTTIDGTAVLIYKGMANHAGTADACKAAYYANKQGLSLDAIAKATSKMLAADSTVKASKIDKSAIEQRALGFKFIIENDLKYTSLTVAKAFTLASKTSYRSVEFPIVLAEYRALGDKATSTALNDLIQDALDRSNADIARKRKEAKEGNGSAGEGSEEGKADDKAAAQILKDNAGQITAYLKAQATRTDFSAADKAMILGALKTFAKALV